MKELSFAIEEGVDKLSEQTRGKRASHVRLISLPYEI
jgi:hypothetical protein